MLLLISLAIGIGALGIGSAAMIFPEQTSPFFGIKVKGDGAVYVRVTGSRDVFIGLIFLYFYSQESVRALAFISFATGFVSASDFIITRKYGAKLISFAHLLATVAVLLYGFLLLRSASF